MSQHLRRYQDWSTVPVTPAGLSVARVSSPDVVIDLTDGHAPSVDIDLTADTDAPDDTEVQFLGIVSEGSTSSASPDDATFVTVPGDEWERMTFAARALLAIRAAADADVAPLGRHIDLRG